MQEAPEGSSGSHSGFLNPQMFGKSTDKPHLCGRAGMRRDGCRSSSLKMVTTFGWQLKPKTMIGMANKASKSHLTNQFTCSNWGSL